MKTIQNFVRRRVVSNLALFWAIISAATFIPVLSIAGEQAEIIGTVTHVRDGDTIEIEEVPVRLYGISAPELNEPLGEHGL